MGPPDAVVHYDAPASRGLMGADDDRAGVRLVDARGEAIDPGQGGPYRLSVGTATSVPDTDRIGRRPYTAAWPDPGTAAALPRRRMPPGWICTIQPPIDGLNTAAAATPRSRSSSAVRIAATRAFLPVPNRRVPLS